MFLILVILCMQIQKKRWPPHMVTFSLCIPYWDTYVQRDWYDSSANQTNPVCTVWNIFFSGFRSFIFNSSPIQIIAAFILYLKAQLSSENFLRFPEKEYTHISLRFGPMLTFISYDSYQIITDGLVSKNNWHIKYVHNARTTSTSQWILFTGIIYTQNRKIYAFLRCFNRFPART